MIVSIKRLKSSASFIHINTFNTMRYDKCSSSFAFAFISPAFGLIKIQHDDNSSSSSRSVIAYYLQWPFMMDFRFAASMESS